MVGLDLPYRRRTWILNSLLICIRVMRAAQGQLTHCTPHVLINMAPTVLSVLPSSPWSSPLHMLSQHVFDDGVRFISLVFISLMILPLMRVSVTLLIWFLVVPHVSCRLLSGMWCSPLLLYLYLRTHLLTRCLSSLRLTWTSELTDTLRCVIC